MGGRWTHLQVRIATVGRRSWVYIISAYDFVPCVGVEQSSVKFNNYDIFCWQMRALLLRCYYHFASLLRSLCR